MFAQQPLEHLRRASRKVREGTRELRAASRGLDLISADVVETTADVERLAHDLTSAVRTSGPLLITTTRAPAPAGAEEAPAP